MVSNVEQAKQFYGSVFGWRFDDSQFPGYTAIDTGSGIPGGMMAKPPGSPIAALNTYFQVDDISQTLHSVVQAGGNVVVPKTEIPLVGWFAMFLDPDQIPIGIFQTSPS
jgi:hypothetical protein